MALSTNHHREGSMQRGRHKRRRRRHLQPQKTQSVHRQYINERTRHVPTMPSRVQPDWIMLSYTTRNKERRRVDATLLICQIACVEQNVCFYVITTKARNSCVSTFYLTAKCFSVGGRGSTLSPNHQKQNHTRITINACFVEIAVVAVLCRV